MQTFIASTPSPTYLPRNTNAAIHEQQQAKRAAHINGAMDRNRSGNTDTDNVTPTSRQDIKNKIKTLKKTRFLSQSLLPYFDGDDDDDNK